MYGNSANSVLKITQIIFRKIYQLINLNRCDSYFHDRLICVSEKIISLYLIT